MVKLYLTVAMYLLAVSAVRCRSVVKVTPEPCCTPDQVETKYNIVIGQSGAGIPLSLTGHGKMHIDAKNGKYATIQRIGSNGQGISINYITTGNYTYMIIPLLRFCSKTPIWSLLGVATMANCIPSNAQYLGAETIGGLGGTTLDVDTWEFPIRFAQFNFNVKRRVTNDKCVSVTDVMSGKSDDGLNQMQVLSYSDFKEGITDPGVFTLPDYCNKE